jgi:tripartite-type tricarboxylate transporter receptor subunit TctC
MRIAMGISFLTLFSATLVNSGLAQSYPAKPVRVLVGFPAASGVDIATRLVTSKMSEARSVAFLVENIALGLTARADPDGYTLGSATAAATVSQSAYASPPFDLMRDFAPVGMLCSVPFVLGIHPSIPAKSIPDLLAIARSRPGQLSYATSGMGSSPHVAFELLKIVGGIDILHVPYKGTVQAIMDTIAGNVSMTLANTLTMLPQVKNGRLRAIAITSAKRSSLAPDLPTFAESGLPGYEFGTWFSILAPAATPQAVVARLNGGIARALQLPDVRERLRALGAEPVISTTEEMNAFFRTEIARVGKVVKSAGIRLD